MDPPQQDPGEQSWGKRGGLAFCDGLIEENVISGNRVYSDISFSDVEGGGVAFCNGTIQQNVITGNEAIGGWYTVQCDGGGLARCSGIVRYNTISANEATYDRDSMFRFDSGNGGGLSWCGGEIFQNIIELNWAANQGGGLFSCWGRIRNNVIRNNGAEDASGYGGAGGGYSGGIVDFEGNVVTGNTATYGGGMSFFGFGDYHSGRICNNIIAWNRAGYGGGLEGYAALIWGNVIFENSASSEYGGIYCSPDGSGLYVQNSVIWGNDSPTPQAGVLPGLQLSYNCLQDADGTGVGNISADPRFVDAENGDFHLLPDSPCIDAGAIGYAPPVTTDYDGNPRPQAVLSTPGGDGSFFDIGAFEYPGVPVSNAYPPARYIRETILGLHPAFPDSDRNGQEGIDIGDFIFALGAE